MLMHWLTGDWILNIFMTSLSSVVYGVFTAMWDALFAMLGLGASNASSTV